MDRRFSRSSPSPRYNALLEMYRALHQQGQAAYGIPAEQTFDGRSLYTELFRIRELFACYGVRSVLDYGCGKAMLHQGVRATVEGASRIVTTRELWQVDEIALYDPGYAPYATLSEDRRFDAVISTDMLEHIPEEDIPWVLDEMFGLANKLVFATVACYTAQKSLPNGENAHCTVQPPDWWRERIVEAAARRPGVHYHMLADTTGQYHVKDPFAGRIGEETIEG